MATRFTRRAFLVRTSRTLAAISAGIAAGRSIEPSRARADTHAPSKRPSVALLESSEFAYISPLRSDGAESRCHAELWYAWIDGQVVVTVAADRWKATALGRGQDRARIWIGDHGRWKNWYGGTSEAFRAAPHFDCTAQRLRDPALLERLLTVYEDKYPDEIDQWRDKMRTGNADGSRILIGYRPT